MKILYIELEYAPEFFLYKILKNAGHDIERVTNAHQGLTDFKKNSYSAIIIRVGDNHEEYALETLKKWRDQNVEEPIIVISNKGCPSKRASILYAGADDCMEFPFELKELFARLDAIIRRCNRNTSPILKHREVALDTGTWEVRRNGQIISLTFREKILLEIFLKSKGRLITRYYLDEVLCQYGRDISSNATEVHIHHLRRKIGREYILTVHGQGYRLNY